MQPLLELLRCPLDGKPLNVEGNALSDGEHTFPFDTGPFAAGTFAAGPFNVGGIPLFADAYCSPDGRVQQRHYDRIAAAYAANTGYPHTQEYTAYLDQELRDVVVAEKLGTVAELCCGRGEAFALFGHQITRGVGVDVSMAMLSAARQLHTKEDFMFVQGDATALPLADRAFDAVFMLGGIHHVRDRNALFSQVARILKPGGHFYFREPVSDFFLWRTLRAIIYRLAPALDHETERPLLFNETAPVLEAAGLRLLTWRTCGFLGFCFLMNSDVLVFNRLFRFLPGIRTLTRAMAKFDAWATALPGLRRAGLQVVGVAEKPQGTAA